MRTLRGPKILWPRGLLTRDLFAVVNLLSLLLFRSLKFAAQSGDVTRHTLSAASLTQRKPDPLLGQSGYQWPTKRSSNPRCSSSRNTSTRRLGSLLYRWEMMKLRATDSSACIVMSPAAADDDDYDDDSSQDARNADVCVTEQWRCNKMSARQSAFNRQPPDINLSNFFKNFYTYILCKTTRV